MMKSRFFIVFILLISAGFYINFHSDISIPTNRPFREFPAFHNEWRMVSKAIFSDDVLAKLRPTDYLSRKYMGSGRIPVYIYIGYHNGGSDSGEIHSPKNCLPGSGWFKLKEDKVSIDVGLKKLNIINALYQKGEEKELFFYWFFVRGKSLTNEYSLKFAEITNSIVYSRKDAAFVRISIPFESNEKEAFLIGTEFIRDFYPVIAEFLPQ